eukprot:66673-Rhodomonas_salina.1
MCVVGMRCAIRTCCSRPRPDIDNAAARFVVTSSEADGSLSGPCSYFPPPLHALPGTDTALFARLDSPRRAR